MALWPLFVVAALAWLPTDEARVLPTMSMRRGAAATTKAPGLRGGRPDNAVLAGLELALVHSHKMTQAVEETLGHLNEALLPVYRALPHSQDGRLEASAVQYLLHRYFIDRYGWFVPGSGRQLAANETLPYLLIGEGRLADSLSQRLGKRGLSLPEVAILAAAVEALASEEAEERLRASYRLAGLSPHEEHASEREVSRIIELNLALVMIGLDYDLITEAEIYETLAEIHEPVPQWDEVFKWTKGLRAEHLAAAPEMRGSFQGLLRVFQTMHARYAHWADKECLNVKRNLATYAAPGTGRVPLDTFYEADLAGGWQADDSVKELRLMGALDETDRRQPSVVVPNYFDTPANCDDSSRYYSVCCISECEALMKHLEHELGTPRAPPQQIVSVVERLPSATVEAPRKLSGQLVRRLDSIAAIYDGHAKLHGRLFRQWMHHVYPMECPFPFLESGPQPNNSAVAEVAEPHIDEVAPAQPVEAEGEVPEVVALEIPWFDEEVVFLRCEGPPDELLSFAVRSDLGQGVIIVIVALCLAARLVQMRGPAARAMGWLPAVAGLADARKLPQ